MKKEVKKNISTLLIAIIFASNGLSALSFEDSSFAQEPTKAPQQSKQTDKILNTKVSINETTEHLPTYKKTVINQVLITENKAVIKQGNIFKLVFAQPFTTKTAKEGDSIIFVMDEPLKTLEGRTLLPAGTKVTAKIKDIVPAESFNRNAEVLLTIDEILLPNGQTGKIGAAIQSNDAYLKRTGWSAAGKTVLWTAGLMGIGAGAGAAIGAAADAAGTGCLALGMPIGGGIGLITGLVTRGMEYKAKAGTPIYIRLTEDLAISY